MGQLHAAGISGCVNASTFAFGERSGIGSLEVRKRDEKVSTNIQRLNKEMAMKKPLILYCLALIAIAPVCFGQGKPAKAGKSAANESTITDLEKSAWEAYKNKQADAFKALMSNDYYGVYAEGVKNLDAEVADMSKTDLREYSFADMKVVFPSPKVAVLTFKATVQATADDKDISGTYNSASVWVQQGKKWVGVCHAEAKAQ
jgi:rRNA maturation endonuclease Nob1